MYKDEQYLIGQKHIGVIPEWHGEEIEWHDSKIKFITDVCYNKSVLDLGCLEHDWRLFRNKYWVHKAICAVAKDVVGLDLYADGVSKLREKGYNVIHGDAQEFELGQTFDVIVAGDLIEHLSNFGSFLDCCHRHMRFESKLILCTPNPWHWVSVIRAMLGPVPVNAEHTCWMCPTTLTQLARRSGFAVTDIQYGTRRMRRHLSWAPLPKRLRNTSWYAILVRSS